MDLTPPRNPIWTGIPMDYPKWWPGVVRRSDLDIKKCSWISNILDSAKRKNCCSCSSHSQSLYQLSIHSTKRRLVIQATSVT